jgi:hypothetical protein
MSALTDHWCDFSFRMKKCAPCRRILREKLMVGLALHAFKTDLDFQVQVNAFPAVSKSSFERSLGDDYDYEQEEKSEESGKQGNQLNKA